MVRGLAVARVVAGVLVQVRPQRLRLHKVQVQPTWRKLIGEDFWGLTGQGFFLRLLRRQNHTYFRI